MLLDIDMSSTLHAYLQILFSIKGGRVEILDSYRAVRVRQQRIIPLQPSLKPL